jgi:threonyl-tRNA synthetase
MVEKFVKQKQQYERILVTKKEAMELFKYNKFKVEILAEKVKDDTMCSVYRCGDLIDPCKGPHVINTSKIKAFMIDKNSSSYWRADSEKETLQRVYAISFPDKLLLKEYKKLVEFAKTRDHRTIGLKQELWFNHPFAPGMMFMLPHGNRIFLTLQENLRKEYKNRGFSEVQSPNLYNSELFEISGHMKNYKDDMFFVKTDNQDHALKPMNCPGHCLIFQFRQRSYKELPIRYADFGVLHRNELKGALSGMTRVRRFQQDDAHIFCRNDQVKSEIKNALEFLENTYGIFGFKFKLFLSTRPKKYMGEIEVWDNAEKQLSEALVLSFLKLG